MAQPLFLDPTTERQYIQLFGELHWIENENIEAAICGSGASIASGLPSGVPIGFPIPPGPSGFHDSCLATADGKQYLYAANEGPSLGTLYWITNEQSKEFYQLNGSLQPLTNFFP